MNISVGIYPVPVVSIDVQVTSYQWSNWVNNVFRNTHIHTTHKQQVRKKRPWRGKGEKGKRKLDYNPETEVLVWFCFVLLKKEKPVT